jgi:hypothetical protein
VNVSRLFVAAVAVLSLVACNKPAPPPPKVEAPKAPPAPTVDADTKRLAAEVYVFAFPLVLMDVTRQVQTARTPLETFSHQRASADAATNAAYPNADFLFSQAWVDLSKGPIALSAPDTKGRYYLVAMLDAWTNVAGSIGKRTTGTEKGEFVIVGPKWKGTLPGGVSEIRSPTDIAWLLGRTRTSGGADDAAAARIQDQFKLGPLGAAGKRGAKATGAPQVAHAGVDDKTEPREQVARMDATTFYSRVSELLASNPPAKEDAPMVDKMKKLGIVAGQPFDASKLAPLQATSVAEGMKSAYEAIATAAKGTGSADVRNGWTIDRDLGRWGVDYGKRAVSAWRGLGVNAPEDAIFLTAHFDGGGHRLAGTNRYVLHFDRASIPPADGFWSVSVYDDKQRFVANRLNRHNLQNDQLKTNADGSIDVYIDRTDPGGERQSNWLPIPDGAFSVMLRVYWPRQEVLDGRWVPPGIRAAT